MKYIVRCSLVNVGTCKAFFRDQEIDESVLVDAGADIERLIRLNAITPASDTEQVESKPVESEPVNREDITLLNRKELNAKAEELGIKDAKKLPNRKAVIEAIEAVTKKD